MLFHTLSLLLTLSTLGLAQDTSLGEVKRAFSNANIPETIKFAFDPKVLLEVTFPQTSAKPITLHAGIQLPRNATVGPPTFNVIGSVSKGPFVVAAVDPDAPTPQTPTSAQIRHFLGGNFFLDTPRTPTLLSNNTPAISHFQQPTPPAGSDPHRYIFLLFNQPKGFNEQTLINSTSSIAMFNISLFAAAVGLGQPIGGSFMLVGPDPST
ncbi:PEBP-like protein [Pholiota conissans]|uniref:PEBP-like protein n=1 Tax=Pholiota conissans TaxID=109636 RepID=A0A9P5Z8J5_9AGAR|nr:PEBP-like protein [Pholiota conissans]